MRRFLFGAPGKFARVPRMSQGLEIRALWVAAIATCLAATCTVRDETVPDTFVESNVQTLTGHQQATFTFSSDEADVTFRCAVDDSAFAPCETPLTTPALADGEHTFAVKAVDIAGNEDDSPATISWVIDSNLPTLSIDGPAQFTRERDAVFAITASKPVLGFRCRIDDGPFAPCPTLSATAATFSHTAAIDGEVTLTVEASDAVGFTATETYTWTIDNVAPVISVTTKPNGINNLNAVAIVFAANEAVMGAICKYDGGVGTSCASLVFTQTPVAEGNHQVKIELTDLAGNPSASVVTWNTDKTKPSLIVGKSGGQWTVTSNEKTKVVASGLNATIEANTVKKWGTAPTTLGNHTMTVTGTDMAGNTRATSYTYCNDNPSGTICD